MSPNGRVDAAASPKSETGLDEHVGGKLSNDLATARRVLQIEAEALLALAENLGEPFLRALDLLQGVAGRVMVTGMGKSGHIARKIAATLASTGTPAYFIHPGEASHGDLGMITRSDAILALSNSGETPELSDVVAHATRFAIPLIAITRVCNSALGNAADVVLQLPATPEACSIGLAPTTSTTSTLALGDALAVALLERQGFTSSDFHLLHPGGKLGARLLKVSHLMHTGDELPLIAPDTPMKDTLLEMTNKRFGCVGVIDPQGCLVGMVTDGDLRRYMDGNNDLLERSAGDIMTANPKTMAANALASEAVLLMNTKNITNLFVTNQGRPIGILHIHDCLQAGVV